ncbi:MAG: flagellar biosynthesis anti-sigma factor FlgM [Thermodesulfobacteriota bacterium]
MKIIDNTITGQAQYARLSSKGIRSEQPPPSRNLSVDTVDEQNDKVMLSEMSRKMRQAIDRIHQLPDVRQDLVTSLRSSLQAGTYRPDPERIAGKMIEEIRSNRSMIPEG